MKIQLFKARLISIFTDVLAAIATIVLPVLLSGSLAMAGPPDDGSGGDTTFHRTDPDEALMAHDQMRIISAIAIPLLLNA